MLSKFTSSDPVKEALAVIESFSESVDPIILFNDLGLTLRVFQTQSKLFPNKNLDAYINFRGRHPSGDYIGVSNKNPLYLFKIYSYAMLWYSLYERNFYKDSESILIPIDSYESLKGTDAFVFAHEILLPSSMIEEDYSDLFNVFSYFQAVEMLAKVYEVPTNIIEERLKELDIIS